jgi:hypothetical protein
MATFANPDFYDNSPARQSFAFHSVVRGRPDPEGAPANLPLLGEAIIGFQILARDDSATVQRLGAGPDMRWLRGHYDRGRNCRQVAT